MCDVGEIIFLLELFLWDIGVNDVVFVFLNVLCFVWG